MITKKIKILLCSNSYTVSLSVGSYCLAKQVKRLFLFFLVLKISSKYRIGCINRELATYRLHKKNESNLKRNIRCKEMSLWLNSYFVKKNLNHMSLEKIENDIIYCNAVTNILNGKKILVLKSLFNILINLVYYPLA